MSREAKALVLGQMGISDVICVEWMQDLVPNFADFDVVFVNEVSLAQLLRGLPESWNIDDARRFTQWLKNVRTDLVKLIASGGRIYSILDEETVRLAFFSNAYREKIPHFVKSSEWCPVPIERQEQKGDTIIVVNDDFKDYLDATVDAWSFTLSIKSDTINFEDDEIAVSFDSKEGKRRLYAIAINRQQQPISAAFGYVDVQKNEGKNPRGGWKYGEPFNTGAVVFLPPPTRIDRDEALPILLETVRRRIGFPLNQSWESYEHQKFIKSNLDNTPVRRFPQVQPVPQPPVPTQLSEEDAEAIRLSKRWKKLIGVAEWLYGIPSALKALPQKAWAFPAISWAFVTANPVREAITFLGSVASIIGLFLFFFK